MILILFIFSLWLQTFAETKVTTEASTNSQPVVLTDKYPPKVAKFAEWHQQKAIIAYTNDEWRALSLIDQISHIYSVNKELISLHGVDSVFSAGQLTCITLLGQLRTGAQDKAEIFRQRLEPQTMAHKGQSCGRNSMGLSCVNPAMLTDILTRSKISSKLPEFSNISAPPEYRAKLASSPNAQLELNLLALIGRLQDSRTKNADEALERFFGHPQKNCRQNYSNKINNCAACINQSVSKECVSQSILSGNIGNRCGAP